MKDQKPSKGDTRTKIPEFIQRMKKSLPLILYKGKGFVRDSKFLEREQRGHAKEFKQQVNNL